jgi:hypothetical protein
LSAVSKKVFLESLFMMIARTLTHALTSVYGYQQPNRSPQLDDRFAI